MQPDLTADQLIEQLFLRLRLRTRCPTSEERAAFSKILSPGFTERILPEGQRPPPIVRPISNHVTWAVLSSPEFVHLP